MAPANQTKKSQFVNFSQGHSGTKVRGVSFVLVFPKKKNTRIHTKMGEIHELFVLALSLVWFAGATPERNGELQKIAGEGAGEIRGAGRSAGKGAAREFSLERNEEQHPRQHSVQHPEFPQHSSQHPPQHFSGVPRFSIL